MGGDCSKKLLKYNVGIVGNGNKAFIVNDVTFNISTMLEATVNQTLKQYRSELIAVHFASASLVLLFTLTTIRYFMSPRRVEKGKIYNET
jgi:hypothetical protein